MANGHIDGLVLHHAAICITDLHPERVENDDGIHPVQRSGLPFSDLVQHGVGDTADQVGGNLQAINVPKMRADVTDSEAGKAYPFGSGRYSILTFRGGEEAEWTCRGLMPLL